MDSDADLSNTWCSRASQFEDRMSPVDWGDREAMKPPFGGQMPQHSGSALCLSPEVTDRFGGPFSYTPQVGTAHIGPSGFSWHSPLESPLEYEMDSATRF